MVGNGNRVRSQSTPSTARGHSTHCSTIWICVTTFNSDRRKMERITLPELPLYERNEWYEWFKGRCRQRREPTGISKISHLLMTSTTRTIPRRILSRCLGLPSTFPEGLTPSTGNPVMYWERLTGKLSCQLPKHSSRLTFMVTICPLLPHEAMTIGTGDRQRLVLDGVTTIISENDCCMGAD